MYTTLCRPPPTSLPVEPEHHSKTQQQRRHAHIHHERRDIPRLRLPRRNKLPHPIAPHIFVDRDTDKDGAGDGFVRVYGVGAYDGGESGDLNSRAGEAYYDRDLAGEKKNRQWKILFDRKGAKTYTPIPLLFQTPSNDKIPQPHDQHIRNHSNQPHLRLSNPIISGRQLRTHPIARGARRRQANNCTYQTGEISEAGREGVEVVRGGFEGLRLYEGEDQKTARGEGDDERGKLDDGEDEDAPGQEEIIG